MARWDDAATWTGDGLRREVFFFASNGVDLYGSLYAADPPTRPLAVAICGSWGVEADQSDALAHGLALATARAGGAGLVFHYAGFGDSHGQLGQATLESLAADAAAAVREGARRFPEARWQLAGFTFGAAIACLAQPLAGADGLVLMQPDLRPSAYLERLVRGARRASFGAGDADMAFGYPLPRRILELGAAADEAVAEALSGFGGEGVAIRYERPPAPDGPSLPDGVERVTIPGSWRFGSRDQPGMAATAARWLRRRRTVAP